MNPIDDEPLFGNIDVEAPIVEPVITLDGIPIRPADVGDTEEQRIARAALQMVHDAEAFLVTDPASYVEAGRVIDALKTKRRDVVEWFAPMVDAAYRSWKTGTEKRAKITDPIDAALAVLSSRYALFAQQEKARADAERRELERAAQQRERDRLQAEADERARESERLRAAATEAKTTAETQLLTRQADDLAAEATQARVDAASVEPPVLPTRSRLAGVKGPTVVPNWTYEVTDKRALVRAVADGVVSLEAIEPNGAYLTKRASADKGTTTIPGVRVYDAGSVRATPRRGRR